MTLGETSLGRRPIHKRVIDRTFQAFLWVSLGIAQSHGGRLQVRNRPGGGSVFSMTLPIGGPPPNAA